MVSLILGILTISAIFYVLIFNDSDFMRSKIGLKTCIFKQNKCSKRDISNEKFKNRAAIGVFISHGVRSS